MPCIIIARGSDELLRVPLGVCETVIGQMPDCDVQLIDPAVMKRHAIIHRPSGEGWRCDFIGSSQPPLQLNDGDRIPLGALTAIFKDDGARDALPTAPARQEAPTSVLTITGDGQIEFGRHLLRAQSGPDSGIEFELKRTRIVLGKDEDCDVRLTDPYVSSHHCRLSHGAGGWHLKDLGSTNGTLVNGVRVAEGGVPLGATLKLGQTVLELGARQERTRVQPLAVREFEGMVGETSRMQELFGMLSVLAPTNAPLLVTGESGTGKELVARAVHRRSARSRAPLFAINCGSLAENLIESELFGHERGAFTGAERRRIGAFESARGGTLFLDEIGELPLLLQSKLLRVLETGDFRRVGGSEVQHADVRIVVATHRDLREMVERGQFRGDLYYRLAVVPVVVPPLRERLADLPLLTDFLLQHMATGSALSVSEGARRKLAAYTWPGNVRELRNVLQRASLFAAAGVIDAEEVVIQPPGAAPVAPSGPGQTLADAERTMIGIALARNDRNRKAAAQELGIARSTLHEKMKKYGLD